MTPGPTSSSATIRMSRKVGKSIEANRSFIPSATSIFGNSIERPRKDNRWGYMVAYDLVSGKIRTIPYRIDENYRPFRVPNEEGVLLSRLKKRCDALSEIDDRTWFETEYSDWYSREMKVWMRLNMTRPSPALWFKWMAWMCMPIQLKYYIQTMRSLMRKAMQEI